MKKITIALAITFLGAALAVAGPHQRGKGFGPRLARELALNDAQRTQIKDVMKASRRENREFFRQARDTRRELFAAKQAGDTARVDALQSTLESQRAQMKQ